jgi:hypothetical protein
MSRKRTYGMLMMLLVIVSGVVSIHHTFHAGGIFRAYFIVFRVIFVLMTLGFITLPAREVVDKSALGPLTLSILMINLLADITSR